MNYLQELRHIGKKLIWMLLFISQASYGIPIPREVRDQYLEVLNRAKGLGIDPIQIPAPGDEWEDADIDPLSLDFIQTLIRIEAGLRDDTIRTHTESGSPDRSKFLFNFCDRCRDKHQPRGPVPSLKWLDFLDYFESDRAHRIELTIGAIEAGALLFIAPLSIVLCAFNLPEYKEVPVCWLSTIPMGAIVSHALIRSVLIVSAKYRNIQLEQTRYLETKEAREAERKILSASILEKFGPIFPSLKEALQALEELIRLRVKDAALPGIEVITIP